jgi:hypothetical protein
VNTQSPILPFLSESDRILTWCDALPQVILVHPRQIVFAGILGGILLSATSTIFSAAAAALSPYNMFDIPGMRPMTDPIALLFFLSPFIIAFVSAILYDLLDTSLRGGTIRKGVVFGLLLFLLITVPNLFIIYSSMYYPAGFFLSSILNGIIGYPLFGVLCAALWRGKSHPDFRKEVSAI